MTTLARHAWFDHPQAARLLRFNLLPSRLFHASRRDEWLPAKAEPLVDTAAEPANDDLLHRHVSAALMRRLDLGLVQGFDDPALPVCLAAQEDFERLALCAGLVVLSPAMRQVIARADVVALEHEVGLFGLQFARRVAPRLWKPAADDGPAPRLATAQAGEQALRLGRALLACALGGTTPPVAWRGLLRLPAQAGDAIGELPASLAYGPSALALTLNILKELDPAWLSSFPAPR